MKKIWNTFILPLLGLGLGVVVYIVYVHVVSLLDPILSIVIGGAFVLVVLITILVFMSNVKDFIVSIFKKQEG